MASGEEGARKGRLGFLWRKGAATQKRATGPSTTASNVQGRIQEDATLLIKLSEVSSLDPIYAAMVVSEPPPDSLALLCARSTQGVE